MFDYNKDAIVVKRAQVPKGIISTEMNLVDGKIYAAINHNFDFFFKILVFHTKPDGRYDLLLLMDFYMDEVTFDDIFIVKDLGPVQAFFNDYLDGQVDYDKHLENTCTPILIPENEGKSEKLKKMLNIILGQLSTHAEEKITEFMIWGDNYCHIVC